MTRLNMSEVAARLDPSGVAISIADAMRPDMPLCYVNPMFETITGYTAEDVLGQNCRFLQGDLENVEARAKMRDALSRGNPGQIVFRNRRADGTIFNNLVVIEPLHDRDGDLLYVVGSQFVLTKQTEVSTTSEAGDQLVHEIGKLLTLNERLRATSRQALARSMAATVKLWLDA